MHYKGSRSLPAPYVGEGDITLTDQELRNMYWDLRREERKGIPTAWAGNVVMATRPRTIQGLDEIEKYFKSEAKNEAMKYRMKELECRVKELENNGKELDAHIMRLLDAIVIKDDGFTKEAVVKENGGDAGQGGEEK